MFKVFCFYAVVIAAVALVVWLGKPSSEFTVPFLAVFALGGGLAIEHVRRSSTSQGRYSLIGIGTAILMLLFGLGAGLMAPTIGLTFLPFGLIFALFVFFALGVPEILLVRRFPRRFAANYFLGGTRFPFFSLGVAIQLTLKM